MFHGTQNTRIKSDNVSVAMQCCVGGIFSGLPPFAFFHIRTNPLHVFALTATYLSPSLSLIGGL